MDDNTLWLVAGVAAVALLASAGQGIGSGVSSVGTGVTDITGAVPFVETQIQGAESWLSTELKNIGTRWGSVV